jgi:hypothetical protein
MKTDNKSKHGQQISTLKQQQQPYMFTPEQQQHEIQWKTETFLDHTKKRPR